MMTEHGTRVIVYNLWEDDQGQLELDFEADKHVSHRFFIPLRIWMTFISNIFPPISYILFTCYRQDIQISGVNRDEKNIQMAKQFPNSRHFLTYRHSLRVGHSFS